MRNPKVHPDSKIFISFKPEKERAEGAFFERFTSITATKKNIANKENNKEIISNVMVSVDGDEFDFQLSSKGETILDAAMNDLMRPALYGSIHKILPSTKKNQYSNKTYEFVGPICESTDKFVTLTKFQEIKEKEIIVLCDVGAYGMSLSSNYNLRPKPIELLIKGSKIKVIKKRQKHKDLI